MSKPFPAIRFHGNNLACVRHIKRGMLELFKTEALQKTMGVPVLRRTIEVSEYTTIMVHIAKEQTFIHITSNPPELPEKVPVTEEKEVEDYLCPYSFLVRKRDRTVKNMPQVNFDHDGYLIAYDGDTRRWRVATFRGKDGSTVPYAANLGWFHAGNDAERGYNHCDVVTWHGQSSPDFEPPFVNTTSGPAFRGPFHFLKSVFYFQGRKLSAPGFVVGACILPEGDDKYFYVHTIGMTLDNWGTASPQSYICRDRCYRQEYAATMAGGSTWTLLYQRDYSDTSLPFEDVGQPGGPYVKGWGPPRSCDFIDENGIAHFIREYASNNLTQGLETRLNYATPLDGNAYIKFNLRTGKYDYEQWFGQCMPRLYQTRDRVFQEYERMVNIYLPFPEPWIFYIWPGTEELCYASIKTEAFGYNNYVYNKVEDGPGYGSWSYSGRWSCQLFIYRGSKIHETFQMSEAQSAGFDSWFKPVVSTITYWSGYAVQRYWKTSYLMEYHPDIPKCKRMVISSMEGQIGQSVLLEDKKTTLIVAIDVPTSLTCEGNDVGTVAYGIQYPTNVAPGGFNDDWAYRQTQYTHAAWRLDASLKQNFEGAGSDYLPWFGIQNDQPEADINRASIPIYGLPTTATFSISLGIRHDPAWRERMIMKGTGGTIHCVNLRADGETQVFFRPDCYAVHRRVPGMSEKPFLYVRKKITPVYLAEAPSGTFPNGRLPIFDQLAGVPRYDETDDYEAPVDTTYGYDMYFGSDPTGGYSSDDTEDEEIYMDTDDWELLSNILTAEELNQMTKETGNAFFDIGIL